MVEQSLPWDGGNKSLDRTRSKTLLLGFLSIFMVATLACSSQAGRPAPADTSSLAPEDVQALIEEAVEEAIKVAVDEAVDEAVVQSGEAISRHELRDLVAEAIAETPPVTRQDDFAELVSKSVSDAMTAGPNPITKVEVERLIQARIAPLRDELGNTSAQVTEISKPTIVFSDLKWQSARIQNRIAMFIVEHGYGYPVETISGETQVLWDNLLDGDSLVTMEVWLPNQQEAWDAAIIDGAVIPLGKSLDENWQGWVIPTYMTSNTGLQYMGDINNEDYILGGR